MLFSEFKKKVSELEKELELNGKNIDDFEVFCNRADDCNNYTCYDDECNLCNKRCGILESIESVVVNDKFRHVVIECDWTSPHQEES